MGAQDVKQSMLCLADSGPGQPGAVGILTARCDNSASAVRSHWPGEGERSSLGSSEVVHMPYNREPLI